ncbi:glycosyl transferase family 1 [Lacrimispora xylanolytica]
MKSIKKALLVTTVSGFVPQFEMSNVNILKEMGYEIHYATNYNTPSYGNDNKRLEDIGIIQHQIDFTRSPFKTQNIKVFNQLKLLMKTQHFDLIHCHTPMGGVMARLAARSTKTTPIIYTAHGFHFFKGASIINWLFYYPIEKFLSRYTDQQICINEEDYRLAKKKLHAKYIDYIPGVGINIDKINYDIDKKSKKNELKIPQNKKVLLSSGELITRKNHETIIRSIAELKEKSLNSSSLQFHYIICGQGSLDAHLRKLTIKLNVSDCVSFLGYREDMMDIFQISDIFLFPSYQEGLPMALLEAMAYGIPVICSDIRGNRDLMAARAIQSLDYCNGGIIIKKANDVSAYGEAINLLITDYTRMRTMGEWNRNRAKDFSKEQVEKCMRKIYSRYI